MAASGFQQEQYTAEHFVESAGAVLFRLSTREIFLLHHLGHDERYLPKGRRNCGETRQEAALREVKEETGLKSRLLPVTMASRAPPAVEMGQSKDEVRIHKDSCDPFALQIRHLGTMSIKLIWWYVAVVDGDQELGPGAGEDAFKVESHGFQDALQALTFQLDREVAQKAIELVTSTYGS